MNWEAIGYKIGVIFTVVVLALVFYALSAWLFMFLWNVIVVYFHHPQLQINFWIAPALLLLISFFFRKK